MKKKTLVVSLLLTLAMVLGTFSTTFAATGAPTDATRAAIEKAAVQTKLKITNEVAAETFTYNFFNEVTTGGYSLINTEELAKEYQNVIVIDTMPAGWWGQRRIPGALNQVVGGDNGPKFEILPDEQKALLKLAKEKTGAKIVTKYWNAKTKKWTTKKPAKKYWKKCTKKKDAFYGKKTKKVYKNYDKKIVVYCGFVGCARSHQAAMFLTKQGFTNVYRYSGGISAWVDANNPIEGSDIG